MSTPSSAKKLMTAADFFAWAKTCPHGRFELEDGVIVAMAPERVRHNLVKGAIYRTLGDAVRAAGLPCTVFSDGVGIVINNHVVREPDASVQRGVEADLDAMSIVAPLIVVEVGSPSSERLDSGVKLVEYFSVPSICHYLLVLPEKRVVVHHRRRKHDVLDTRIAHDGGIVLDPPGMTVAVSALLGPSAEPEAGP